MTIPTRIPSLLLAAILVALALSSCAPPPIRPEDNPELQRAEQLRHAGDLEGAAAIYWQQAQTFRSPHKESLQLRAVEILLTPETADAAERYLAQISESGMKGPILARRRIAQARLALMAGQPAAALAALPASLDAAAPAHVAQMQELRAQALLAQGQLLDSFLLRVERSRLPLTPDEQAANAQAIWQTLLGAGPEQLHDWSLRVSGTDPRGWIALAYIAKTAPASVTGLQEELAAWRTRFPAHPADPAYPVRLLEDWELLRFQPNNVAVMLPLTGRYAQVAGAILAGIVAAYYDASPERPDARITVYDTGDVAEQAVDAFRQAVADGADAIIGPLDKRAVIAVGSQPDIPVPVISLNYLAADIPSPPNFYQFGLLPEDEAHQVAERAVADGNRRALAFVPDGQWGIRMLQAFRHRFEELGGTVAEVERYTTDQTDFSAPIRKALELDQSRQRFKTLKNTLQQDIEFEPRRRQDVDMIFLAANPRQARALRPQLIFHFAGDLPVYATSASYSGAPDPYYDRDLNGLIFSDMPFVIGDQEYARQVRERLVRLFPENSSRFPRLMALGYDAFTLLPRARLLAKYEYERHAGLTGRLSMADNQRVYRELDWARFVDGSPGLLPALEMPVEPATPPAP